MTNEQLVSWFPRYIVTYIASITLSDNGYSEDQ